MADCNCQTGLDTEAEAITHANGADGFRDIGTVAYWKCNDCEKWHVGLSEIMSLFPNDPVQFTSFTQVP